MSRFSTGDRVRIRAQRTLSHSRVPAYVQGRSGVIERVLPEFVIFEDDAWGRLWQGGRSETLYRVQLHQADTWPGYRGEPGDTHELEIFEHWLEPAEETP
jgi:thiocyanate hydrolase subunit alpha